VRGPARRNKRRQGKTKQGGRPFHLGVYRAGPQKPDKDG
jgi:hypothetical protein